MNTARAVAGPQVEREEAAAGEAEREREASTVSFGCAVDRVDREVSAGDDRERRGEAVHVVEQVERVRDADEPEEAIATPSMSFADDLDGRPARDHDDRGRELRGELRERAQVPEIVDEPRDEHDRDAREDPAELPHGSTAPTASASATPADETARRCRRRRTSASRARASARRWVARPACDAAAGARRRAQRASAATGRAAIVTAASTVAQG